MLLVNINDMPNVNLFSCALRLLFFISFSASVFGQVTLDVSSSSFEFPHLDKSSFRSANQLLLVANNPNVEDRRSYLIKMSIKGNGIEMTSTSQQEISFSFEGIPTRVFNSLELSKYFDINNLDLKGISQKQYYEFGLPEGSYQICFKVFDVTLDAYSQVSKDACINYWVTNQLPPKITYPIDKSELTSTELKSVEWISQHSTFSQVEFEVMIFEQYKSVNAFELLQFYKPIWTGISYVGFLNSNDLGSYLIDGQNYTVFVKARGVANLINFKNNGFSEPVTFKYKASLSEKLKDNIPGSCIPSSSVFINEISQGRDGKVNEFIELVVVGGDSNSEFVDLSGLIIDDNNYDNVDVGNESGHIRLGSCFSEIPRGSIILLYDDRNIHSGISSINDGLPNTSGVYQLPISSSCIDKYIGCPNMFQDKTDFDCGYYNSGGYGWAELIPLNNLHDVAQLRDENQELEHAILWGTSDYEFSGTEMTIDFSSTNNLIGRRIAMMHGEDWFDSANFEVGSYTSATPGVGNSQANLDLIQSIKDYEPSSNIFSIDCSLEFLPTTTAIRIDITDDPITTYTLIINDDIDNSRMFTGEFTRVLDVEEGVYSIRVINELTGCEDVCVITVVFECQAGDPCDDFNDCTTNDMLTEDCKCEGTPLNQITFTEENIYQEVCDYCAPIFPWDEETLYNELNITSFTLKDIDGNIITIDNSLNVGNSGTGSVFHFPYCIGRFNACGTADWPILSTDLQLWLTESGIEGTVTAVECPVNRTLAILGSGIEFVSINSISNLGGPISFDYSKSNCTNLEIIIGTTVTVLSDCEAIDEVLWSNGSTENPLDIYNGLGCYEVQVTCSSGCIFTEIWGDGCDCLEDGQSEECCVVGQPCEPINPPNCVQDAYWDENCNCIIIEGLDTDNDGYCDDVDLCQGFDDDDDWDGDGVPDGCDLCQGTVDSLYLVLINNDDLNDDPECDTIPCPEEIDYEFDYVTNGMEACDYCLDLSGFQYNVSHDLYFGGINGYFKNEEVHSNILNDWEEIQFSNFDSSDDDWEGVSKYVERYNDADLAKSGTYSMVMYSKGTMERFIDQGTPVSNPNKSICQLRVDFSFISKFLSSDSESIHLEYSDANGNWKIAKSLHYKKHFNNDERQDITVFIDDNFDNKSKLRVRVFTEYPLKSGIFVDDIRVRKMSRAKNIEQCMTALNDLEVFVKHLDNWIVDVGGKHEGIEIVESGSVKCGTDGLTVIVRNSTVGLTNIEVEGGTSHAQFDFTSPNCDPYLPGQFDYDVTVTAECEDATYLWSNGETTQTINIPYLATYTVTVTCGDDCEYVLVFDPPNPDCVVGEPCDGNGDEEGDCPGVLNEYCDCIVEVNLINDIDEDGIPDCIDPCPFLDVHDANNNDILDCEECQCADEPVLVYSVSDNDEVCSKCIDLEEGIGDEILNLTYNGLALNTLHDTFGFHFPYLNDTIYHDPLDPSNWNDFGVNHLFADFYAYHPNNQDSTGINDVIIYLHKDSLFCVGDNFSATIVGLDEGEEFRLSYNSNSVTPNNETCDEIPSGYNVSLFVDNCSACGNLDAITYEWSDGSTASTPYEPLDDLDQGYAVTITCEGGCTYVINPEWDHDCIIGAPCDDGDPCTEGDQYVLGNEYGIECFCEGTVSDDADDDGDGVANDCDICEGFDDNIDTDYDGVPNGCDICEGGYDALLLDNDPTNDPENCQDCNSDFVPVICRAFTEISSRECYKNTFIHGFTVKIPGYGFIQVSYNLNTAGLLHFPYCWGNNGTCDTGTDIADFEGDFQDWLDHMGYGGIANVVINSSGFSLSIFNTELVFQNLNWDCGAATKSNNRIPSNFKVDCDAVLESVTGNQNTGSGSSNPYNLCDDGNECTVYDSFNENCECEGIYMDSDDDTVCDPLDECPNWPDYLGCSEFVECLLPNPTPPDYISDEVHLCEYFYNMASNAENSENLSDSPKVIQQSISEIMCMLNELINDPEYDGENFNIPGLESQIANPTSPSSDQDDDGVINLLDIFPYDDSRPSGGYYSLDDFTYPGFCEDHFAKVGTYQDPQDLIMPAALFVRSFLFIVVNDNYNSTPNGNCDYAISSCSEPDNMPSSFTPGCAEELGVSIIEDASCILREASTGCAIYFYIDCNGDCQYYTTGDHDGNGVCGNETIITGCDIECPQPEDSPCQIWGLNQETCECEPIGDNYDDDGDTVCNADDICPGGDDLEDADGDGIPDDCDDCDSGGIGDPCDDGNPCTFADHVIELADGTCDCQGVAIDTDGDGVYDCDDCDAAVDSDGDGYIDQVNTWTFDHEWPDGTIETLTACDVCPELDDSIDLNNDGIPDCVAPLFVEIGCPDSIQIVPGEGILLTFSSDDITEDQLPQILDLTYIFSGGLNNQITTEKDIVYDYVRELNGEFEIFYGLPSLQAGDYPYLAVLYSDHQPCILNNENPLSELNCPDLVEYNNNGTSTWLQMDFSIPSDYSYDILSVAGSIGFNPGIGNPPVSSIDIETNFVTAPNSSEISIDFYGIEGLGDLSNYVGTITLPNGTECAISGGSTEPDCQDADGNDVTEGNPCDDGDDCTHHDKWIDNGTECECIGEPKPDTDQDGVCDEFDECTGEPGDPATTNDPVTGLCPCPELVLTPVGLVNGNDFEIELDMSLADQFSNLSVSVTGGPEDTTTDMGFSSPLVVPNLAYGYTYAIVITGECANGGTSVATAAIDVPFGEDQFFCGVSLEPQTVGSVNLLPQLAVGDTITAADFRVNVRKASGSYGKFTGKGYISIPYLNFVRINVSFKDITVATNMQMIDGCINVDGYGVSILGDDISDAINDAVNDIINVLEEISDILEDLIPLLEDIEELVETTGDLVSESAKTCIEDAKSDLEALQLIAEGPSPPADIADQIKAAVVVLEQCHIMYQAELEQILNDLNYIVSETLNIMIGQCSDPLFYEDWDTDWDSNSYQDFINDFTTKMATMLDEFPVSNDPEKGLGETIYDIGFEQETEEEYDFTELPSEMLLESSAYYTIESNYQFCYILDQYEGASNGFSGLDVATFFAKAFLEIGTELVDDISARLDAGETKEAIANDPNFHQTFQTAFQELLRYESYQNK